MRSKVTKTADLVELFAAKATAPPPESSQILVRHFQCKEPLKAAQCLVEAMDRHIPSDGHPLPGSNRTIAPAGDNITLAPVFTQALPLLGTVPTTYSHEFRAELLYDLCAALVKEGLGGPETWQKCEGSVHRGCRSRRDQARRRSGRRYPRDPRPQIGPAATASPEACLDNLYRRLDAAAAEYGPIDAIGVGTASMVDFRGGRIVQSVNLPLRDVPLRDLLSERYGVPVVVDNDANVACLAEFRYGAGSGTSEMIMLTLGTGIGGGIVTNGHLYRGASGAAAEIGHMMIDFDGPPCRGSCPNHGCLEVYASGHAMGEAARDTARAQPDSALGRALAAGDEVGGPLLSALALAGDPVATAVLDGIGEKLGLGIVSLVNIFNPELVVVGGGAAQAADIVLGAGARGRGRARPAAQSRPGAHRAGSPRGRCRRARRGGARHHRAVPRRGPGARSLAVGRGGRGDAAGPCCRAPGLPVSLEQERSIVGERRPASPDRR